MPFEPQALRTKVALSEVVRDPSSYVDPHGFVFHWQDQIFRYVSGQAAPRFQSHLDGGLLQRLRDEFHLVETELAPLEIPELGEGLVLVHRKLPLTYCTEWSPAMLRDAGLVTLDLALALLEEDLCLQDAYPWNVLFDGAQPVFVDVTSIVEVDTAAIWPAHEQFDAYFLRPSVLSAEGKGRAVRALMLDNIAGVRLAEFHNLVSTRYRMTHPQLWMTLALDRYLQRSVGAKDRVRRLSERAMATVDRATRRRFLQRLRRRLGAVRFSTQPDPWTRYYGEIDPEFDRQLKLETVRRLLREDRPKSVLDLGCNTGVFALEAARTGARTIAVDSSEACVDGLYLAARAENLPLTPLVADVLCPTPAYGFLSRQYPDLYSRVRSDLVLCLGLMHHLVVAGRQSLERIAEIIAMASRDKAIFEYVGPDDANMPHLSGRRDISYSAEDVIKALAKHFTRIERMPSDRPTRELLHCQR